jgi:hypothetical protein
MGDQIEKKKIEEAKLKINKLGVKFNFFFQKKKKNWEKILGLGGVRAPLAPM